MAEFDANVQKMFENINKRGPVWKSVVLTLTFLANIYVLAFLKNLESPWTVVWFYVNALFMTFMISAPIIGLKFPKLQVILIIGFVLAMFTQAGLVVTGPLMIRLGAGDAAPFLLLLWCAKLIVFVL